MKQFQSEFQRCQHRIEQELAAYFTEQLPQRQLLDAMRYSLMAGGKRVRPILTLKFCEAAGGSLEQALPFACAVEMLHTYSLIHDDLPSMDNDDLRRGKPTNHKVFGECTAILAGDALQTAAFETILSAPLPAEITAAAGLTLARAAGVLGMCGGQQLDMEGEERALTLAEVTNMNQLKTGCLLNAACVLGVLAAGASLDDPMTKGAEQYAQAIGLAFQVRDDMLNVTSTEARMGKPVGNDAQSHKSTYVSLLGLERCDQVIAEQTERAKAAIRGRLSETTFLEELADYLAGRTN